MGIEFLLGLMEENMRENIKMIKKKVMEYLNGPMEQNLKGYGKMENKTERKKCFFLQKILGKKVYGKMERG